jgi:hypothetical protein
MSLLLRVIVSLAAGAVAGMLGFYAIRAAVLQTVQGQIDVDRFDQWLLTGLIAPLVVVAPLVFLAVRRRSQQAIAG